MRVCDIMSVPAVTVAPGRSVKDVATLFDHLRISAVPVVADDGICGIVSKTDVVRFEQQFEPPGRAALVILRGAPHPGSVRLSRSRG